MTPRTIGLFGGTFDPPHLGHVAVARDVLATLSLDVLVVTVAADPQAKAARPVATPARRLEMATAAFGGLEGVTVSDVELRRGGPTYTIDTVEGMLDAEPGARIVLVVGADAAAGLGHWHRAGALAPLVTVAVIPRPGYGSAVPSEEGFVGVVVDTVPVDLSSTEVRGLLAAGADPASLVPLPVVPLLLAHRLYAP